MSESSTRLPENEVGGHPQTGEGAVRRLGISESVVAGDPVVEAALAEPVEQAVTLSAGEVEVPADAVPDLVVPVLSDPAPLIPPVTPADSQE